MQNRQSSDDYFRPWQWQCWCRAATFMAALFHCQGISLAVAWHWHRSNAASMPCHRHKTNWFALDLQPVMSLGVPAPSQHGLLRRQIVSGQRKMLLLLRSGVAPCRTAATTAGEDASLYGEARGSTPYPVLLGGFAATKNLPRTHIHEIE